MTTITEENISIVIQIATLIGIIFGVYLYFRKPQEKSETNDAIFGVEFKNLEKTFNDKFLQSDRELANLRDNHIHTLGVKMDKHIDDQGKNEMLVCEKLARLETKLDVLIKK